MKNIVILLAASLFSMAAWSSCYTVLGPKGDVLSESTNPPVDMSYSLHETVPARFGEGAIMIFGVADGHCGARIDPDEAGLAATQARAETATPAVPRLPQTERY